ncbi:PorP/SprF family type IX secretion system membrane protein [Flexithrix dorotheae]|uniref:PorP/SprF family type IX secretion system membrane protein n=1 Tax=Flexithrix dorotheae TaxID=70993 RepID=UPI000477B5FE|nr:PorP/SprF family type IX secretion system membrane protein [Flexithrix dorotheae]
MKLSALLPLIFVISFYQLSAQDLPVYIQKQNVGLMYNPSISGLKEASYDFAYENKWSGVEGAFNKSYLGFQSPLNSGNLGMSFNIYYEKFNVFQTVDFSGGLAYHALLNDNAVLSFGLSAEFISTSLNLNDVQVVDLSDPVIFDFTKQNKFDGYFGVNFSTPKFQTGFSFNRIMTALKSEDNKTQGDIIHPDFFTAYGLITLPVSNERDKFEILAYYKKFSTFTGVADLGAYYTYNNKFTLGGNYSTNSAAHIAAGVTIIENLSLGYSHEILLKNFSGVVGASDEITIRYTFDQVESIFNTTSGGRNFGKTASRRLNKIYTVKKKRGKGRNPTDSHSPGKRKKMRNFRGPKN